MGRERVHQAREVNKLADRKSGIDSYNKLVQKWKCLFYQSFVQKFSTIENHKELFQLLSADILQQRTNEEYKF